MPGERCARCLGQQVRVVVNEAADRDGRISDRSHASIMPGYQERAA